MVKVLLCKLEDFFTFSEMSGHLRFFWEVAEHVCFAFAFVVLLPFGIADCSSAPGFSFEFVHRVHINTVCPGFHPGSSSEAAMEQLFDLLQTGLVQCKHL